MKQDIATEMRNRIINACVHDPIDPSYAEYLLDCQHNLLPGLPVGFDVNFLRPLARFEFSPQSRAPPKANAVYSSFMLAANAFGPFVSGPGDPALLSMPGHKGVSWQHVQLEKSCRFGAAPPIGNIQGAASLDLVLQSDVADRVIVGIESKFAEALEFSPHKFDSKVNAYAHLTRHHQASEPTWQALYQRMCRDKKLFEPLGAGQLLKHCYGLRHTYQKELNDGWKLELVYLHWEPTNWQSHPHFRQLRDQFDLFEQQLSDGHTPSVCVRRLSYLDLFESWSNGSTALIQHANELRSRYQFPI